MIDCLQGARYPGLGYRVSGRSQRQLGGAPTAFAAPPNHSLQGKIMQKRSNGSFTLLQCSIALGLALVFFSSTASADYGLTIVNLKNPKTTLQGVERSWGYEFLGIPYAAPPARWQAPEPHPGWDGVRDASTYGSTCPQDPTPFGTASENEDCLFLNVYRPKGAEEKAPVMVYIHGGALLHGESDPYLPVKFVQQGLVVVTVNYRIGALGFLSHPALSAASPTGVSGNYGIMDQQLALQWVQENIKRFGGDPDNVTIFGESAGGHSVLAHLSAPSSAGLFHRAIVQSGAYALQQQTMAEWEQAGLAIIAAAGCPDQNLECMLQLPVANLLAAQPLGGTSYRTVVDGQLLPTTAGYALATGQFNRVPILNGNTRDEFSLFVAVYFDLRGNPVTPESYLYAIIGILNLDPADPAQMYLANTLASYIYPLPAFATPGQAVSAIGTDAVFACNALALSNFASQYVPTYAYEFNDPNAPQIYLPPVSFPYGAYHVSELQYLFSLPNGGGFTPEQEALSDTMVTYWAQFAQYGDPNGAGEPVWPAYNPAAGQITLQSLEPLSAQPITVMDFAASHQCEFWASL